jgi:hypothetical protein
MQPTGIAQAAGSSDDPLHCTDALSRRKVPRAGYAAAQDDIIESGAQKYWPLTTRH